MFLGCIPAHAAYFSIYEWGKEFFGANRPGHHVLAAFASGGLATTAHDFIMTPLDVVKQRMQLGYYRNVRHCVYSILKTEGFTALWLSLPTTLLLNIPFAGVNVAVNESCKKILNPDGKPSVGTFLISGAIAGGCAAAVTVPLDVIKTRQQTQNVMECPGKFFATVASSEAEALAQPAAGNAQHKTLSSEVVRRQYTGMLSTARQILKEEGWWAFTSGLRVRVLTNAPAVAISWTTYELFKSVLNGALDSSA